jgi:hypothetical protein
LKKRRRRMEEKKGKAAEAIPSSWFMSSYLPSSCCCCRRRWKKGDFQLPAINQVNRPKRERGGADVEKGGNAVDAHPPRV